MASNIDIYLDSGGSGIVFGGSAPQGNFPDLTRNDVYNLRVLLQDAPQGVPPLDLDTTGGSFKVAIGQVDEGPSSGQFKLSVNGVTSSAINYSLDEATLASSIFTALSNNVSTVSQFGIEQDSFILTATGTNTALSVAGDAFTLFPTSSILASTRRDKAANINTQQIIKIRRNPVVYSDIFTTAATAGAISLIKSQDGDSATNKNETYRLEISPLVAGGQFILNYGTNSTTGIPVGLLSSNVQILLSAITGIGANNIAVAELPNGKGYTIAFVRELGNQNITTALSLDASGIYYRPWKQTTLTMATSELDELFADEGTDSITPTIEIEYSENGNPKTLYQGQVTVRKDLITAGSSVPSPQASYYTKSEADSKFVEDLTTGAAGSINATNWKLEDSTSADSLDWQNRKLYDGAIERVSWSGGLGFYGTSAIAKPTGSNLVNSVSNLGLLSYSTPTQANVINNLVSAGILSSSATYGVLPSSPRTLTTTASIYFGQVNSNSTNSVSVVVTGCNLNDVVLLGLPANINNGLAFAGHVTVANGLELDCINATNGNITPATATYRITVIGY
jgi:hypothetical protein